MDVVEKISDRIILLADSRVVADGTFKELQQHSHEGSLEEVFNQLTGFHDHARIAERFVSIVREEVDMGIGIIVSNAEDTGSLSGNYFENGCRLCNPAPDPPCQIADGFEACTCHIIFKQQEERRRAGQEPVCQLPLAVRLNRACPDAVCVLEQSGIFNADEHPVCDPHVLDHELHDFRFLFRRLMCATAILMTKPIDGRTVGLARSIHAGIYLPLTGALSAGSLVVGLFKHGVLFFLIYILELILMNMLILVSTSLVYLLSLSIGMERN